MLFDATSHLIGTLHSRKHDSESQDRHPSSVLAFLFVVAIAWNPGMAGGEDVITDIPQTAITAWKQHEESLNGIQSRYRYVRKVVVADEVKLVENELYEFGTTPQGRFLKRYNGQRVEAAAVNTLYSFQADKEGDDFELFELMTFRYVRANDPIDRGIGDFYEPFLFAGFEVLGKKIRELPSANGFAVQSFTEDETEGVAVMEFTYSPSVLDTAITGGKITFSKSSNWVIQSYDCTTTWGRMEGEVSYRKFEGLHVPASYHIKMIGADSESRVTYDMQDVRLLAVDEAPVWLRDYGLTVPAKEFTKCKAPGNR